MSMPQINSSSWVFIVSFLYIFFSFSLFFFFFFSDPLLSSPFYFSLTILLF